MTRPGEGASGPLASEIALFLEHKRVLGRRFETEAYALRLFDRFLVERGIPSASAVTPETIDVFLASRPRHRPRSFNHLVGVLRRLFKWLVVREIVARSPVQTPLRRGGTMRTPFVFSPEHARQLLVLAKRLPDYPGWGSELRGPTYHAIFAVLYGLGLRVGEACRLNVEDLDRRHQLLVVRDTKFGKDRLVPFGPRVGQTLGQYLALRRASGQRLAHDAPLFSVCSGHRLRRQQIGTVLRQLLPKLGLPMTPGSPDSPCVHDLRRSFAVRTLLRWYRAGIDPGRRLLHLSTFLGHVQPESTAVYLTITAELLSEASWRFEAYAPPLVREARR